MRISWQVEIDDWCRQVLAKHWPDVERYGDIHGVGQHNLEPVDVIAGGFPCQPVSLAGRRLAQDDDRWLWPQFARVIRELRPRYVLLENVPGFLVRGFGDVLGDLAACGYDAEWECIPASAVGANHQRDRVWIVAYSQKQSVGAGLRTGESAAIGRRRLGDGGGSGSHWWAVEPNVGRVADGVPARVDRLRGLGNAVVPQVVEWIGRRIVEHSVGGR